MRRKRKRRKVVEGRTESPFKTPTSQQASSSCLKSLLSVAIIISILTSSTTFGDSQVKATSRVEDPTLFERRLEIAKTRRSSFLAPEEPTGRIKVARGVSNGGPLIRTKAGRRVELACHVFGRPLEFSVEGQKWTDRSNAATSGHANDPASDHHDNAITNSEHSIKKTTDQSMPLASIGMRPIEGGRTEKTKREEEIEEESDLISLIFWYKDDNPTPIYTLDARQVSLSQAASGQDKKWPSSRVSEENLARNKLLLSGAKHYPSLEPAARSLRSRVHLEVGDEYPVIKLILKSSEARDSGTYKCRVDFRRSRTISQLVRLLVEVPVTGVNISLSSTTEPEAVLPSNLNENQRLDLSCHAYDGSPAPQLGWLVRWAQPSGWSQPEPLTSDGVAGLEIRSKSIDPMEGGRLVEASSVTIRNLDRRFHGARIGCQASQEQTFAVELANYRIQSGSAGSAAVDSTTNQDSPEANSPPPPTTQTVPGIKMIDDSSSRRFIIVTPARDGQRNRINNEPANANRLFIKQTWIDLKLNLKPQSVDLQATARFSSFGLDSSEVLYRDSQGQLRTKDLSEGDKIRLVCSSHGSHPEARLRWRWISARAGGDFREGNNTVQRQTESGSLELELTITRQHHLIELACEATNEQLPVSQTERVLTARLRFYVKFGPIVRLVEARKRHKLSEHPKQKHLGPQDDRRELICQVESNPPINQLVWLLDEQPLARVMSSLSVNVGQISAPENNSIRGHHGQGGSGEEAEAEGDAEAEAQEHGGWRARFQPAGRVETLQPQQLRDLEFGSKFKIVGLHKLIVLNLTMLDSIDDYKCKAINSIGEGVSQKLRLSIDYRPVCEASALGGQVAEHSGSGSATSQLGHVRVVQMRTSGITPSSRILCHSQARPAPTKFLWAFVPLSRLTRGIAQVNNKQNNVMQSRVPVAKGLEPNKLDAITSGLPDEWQQEVKAMITFYSETISNELELESELFKFDELEPTEALGGLLICKASNKIGLQEQPCLSLLTNSSEEMHEPDAGNCTLKPLLEETSLSWAPREKVASPKGGRVAISVDCSATRDKDKLIFQLAIARRRDLSARRASTRPRKTPIFRNLTGANVEPTSAESSAGGIFSPFPPLPADEETYFLERPLMFTQATSARLPINELFPIEELGQAENRSGEVQADGSGEPASIEQQLEFLKDLVFTIRASNLLSTSQPHPISGSELKLSNLSNIQSWTEHPEATQSSSERKQLMRAERLNSNSGSDGEVIQVSRSTSSSRDQSDKRSELFVEFQPSASKSPATLSSFGNIQQASSTRQQVTTTATKNPSELSPSPLDFNINVVAICVGVLLSLFNIALIGVLLRSHKTTIARDAAMANTSESSNGTNNYDFSGSPVDASAARFQSGLPVQELVLTSTSPLGELETAASVYHHHHQLLGSPQETFNREAVTDSRLGCIVEYAFL